MRSFVTLLIVVCAYITGAGQEIRVRAPFAVDGNYQYRFLQNGRYVLGIPMGGGLLTNVPRYCLWDARSGKYIHSFENGEPGNHECTFSPDGRWYAVLPSGRELYFGDVASDVFV